MRRTDQFRVIRDVKKDMAELNEIVKEKYNKWNVKNVKVSPKQEEVIKEILDNSNEANSYILVWWWANWWKSYWICIWILATCIKYPWIKWCVWRSTVQDTNRSIKLTLRKVLKSLWYKQGNRWKLWNTVSDWDYYSDWRANLYHFLNWSEIWFLQFWRVPSDEEYQFLSWQEYTYCYIDEVQDWVEKQAVDVITQRLRHMNDYYWIHPKVIMSCNPKKCWIKEEFYDPRKEWKEKKWNKFIQMLYTDNLAINQEKYRDQILRTENKVEIERKLKGNWEYDDTPWKLYNYDDLQNMFSDNPIEIDNSIIWLIDANLDDKYLLTIDPSWNWSDKAVCFVWKGWNVIDSVVMTGSVDWFEFKRKILAMKEKYWIRNKYIVNDSNWIWWHLSNELNATEKHLNDWLNTVLTYYAQSTELPEWFKREKKKYWILRDQCFWLLKNYIKRIRIQDEKLLKYKNDIIDELDVVTQVDMDNDAWLVKILPKKAIKAVINSSSPDLWDNFSFRVYAELKLANFRNIDINKLNQKINENVFKWYRSF